MDLRVLPRRCSSTHYPRDTINTMNTVVPPNARKKPPTIQVSATHFMTNEEALANLRWAANTQLRININGAQAIVLAAVLSRVRTAREAFVGPLDRTAGDFIAKLRDQLVGHYHANASAMVGALLPDVFGEIVCSPLADDLYDLITPPPAPGEKTSQEEFQAALENIAFTGDDLPTKP